MQEPSAISNGELLGFAQRVIAHIDPLVIPLGFKQVDVLPNRVIYQSSLVSIMISLGSYTYEVDVCFWPNEDPENRLDLASMVLESCDAMNEEQISFQASTPERVEIVVNAIAGLIEKHAAKVLSGDAVAFRNVVDKARFRNRIEQERRSLIRLRFIAEDAWKNKNYDQVQQIYEQMGVNLTPMEKMRLKMARHYLGHQ